jgi:hypothetical protein
MKVLKRQVRVGKFTVGDEHPGCLGLLRMHVLYAAKRGRWSGGQRGVDDWRGAPAWLTV